MNTEATMLNYLARKAYGYMKVSKIFYSALNDKCKWNLGKYLFWRFCKIYTKEINRKVRMCLILEIMHFF